jgi:hypothetical protein
MFTKQWVHLLLVSIMATDGYKDLYRSENFLKGKVSASTN